MTTCVHFYSERNPHTPVEDWTTGFFRKGDTQIFGHSELAAKTAVTDDVFLTDVFVREDGVTISSCYKRNTR